MESLIENSDRFLMIFEGITSTCSTKISFLYIRSDLIGPAHDLHHQKIKKKLRAKEFSPLHGEIGHLTAQIKIPSTNFSVRYHVGLLKTRRNRLSSFKKFPRVHQKISSDRRFLAIFKLASLSLRFFFRIDLTNFERQDPSRS